METNYPPGFICRQILDELSLGFYSLGLLKPYHSAVAAARFFIAADQAVGRTAELGYAAILRPLRGLFWLASGWEVFAFA
jgi:hypothetical protein